MAKAQHADKWLFELHNKLWGKEQLRNSLFRTVEVTTAHYHELQARLDAKHPNRNSDSYVAEKDVLSTKLDVLLNFTLSSPPPVIDFDDEDAEYDDVDVQLSEVLPAKMTFLDLSSLELKASPRTSFPILIRKEYGLISALLKKDTRASFPAGGQGSVLTGQSGIGKTAYLYTILIDRLLGAKETYFETKAGNLYEISDTVKPVGTHGKGSLSGADRLALLDGPSTSGAFKVSHTPHMIWTASLLEQRSRKTAFGLLGAPYAKVYVMDGWSTQELILAGVFLSTLDITFARLQEAAIYLGDTPHCFDMCVSENKLLAEQKSIEAAIEALPRSTTIESFFNSCNKISLPFLQVTPKDETRLVERSSVDTRSKWIFNALMDEFEKRDNDSVYRYYLKLGERTES